MPAKTVLKGSNKLVKVSVTQAIIDRAERGDSGHCMIADAIRAALPEVTTVSVDLSTIRFTDPAKRQRYIYLTPDIAQQALVDFDQGITNEPFLFRLTKAVQVVESGRRTTTDGTKVMPSRAVQGVIGAGGSRQPTKLGGKLPPRAVLSSTPSKAGGGVGRRKKPAEPIVKHLGPTAAEKRAAALEMAKAQVAARDRGEPVTGSKANIKLAVTPSRIRKFGMRQLRA